MIKNIQLIDILAVVVQEQYPYTPTSTQNYNPNEYQQEQYVDDAKDLHYSSQHGGHSNEFTISSSHGQSGGDTGSSSSSSSSGHNSEYMSSHSHSHSQGM